MIHEMAGLLRGIAAGSLWRLAPADDADRLVIHSTAAHEHVWRLCRTVDIVSDYLCTKLMQAAARKG